MTKLHTPWQYLLDIVGSARIKEAEQSGDPAFLKQQRAYYQDLDESECTFTTPYQHPDNKKYWLTNMTCLPRKFKLNRLRFNTGKIDNMIEPNAGYITERNSLNRSTVENLYRVFDHLDTYHLLVKKDTDLDAALEMTGFRFQASEYTKVMYETRNKEFEADGHFDIVTPIIAGRIYITYVIRDLEAEHKAAAEEKAAQEELNKAPVAENVAPVEPTKPEVEEDAPVETVEAESSEGEVVKEADAEPEVQDEDKAPEVEAVKPQQAPVQNFNKNNKKK